MIEEKDLKNLQVFKYGRLWFAKAIFGNQEYESEGSSEEDAKEGLINVINQMAPILSQDEKLNESIDKILFNKFYKWCDVEKSFKQ